MNKHPALRCAAALCLFAAAGTADAAVTLAKEGNFAVISCWSGTGSDLAFTKDMTISSYEMIGTVVSNVPNGLGDHSTFRCIGTSNMTKGKTSGGNYCETVDPDGDKRLNRFDVQDGKVTREFVAGTGKYEGMTLTNTVVTPFPAFKEHKPGVFQGCNRQTGTYKLKCSPGRAIPWP